MCKREQIDSILKGVSGKDALGLVNIKKLITMKKLILSTILFAAFILNIKAQGIHIGVKLGANLNKISLNSPVVSKGFCVLA